MRSGLELVVAWPQRESRTFGAAALSSAERERAARLRFEADRRRYVASRLLLRSLLAERAGASDLRFSLSRSGELAAFAFARGRPVGVDVEAIRFIDNAGALAERAFARREWRAFAARPASERQAAFYRGWTRTEALAKALGGGLALGPDALEAALDAGWVVHSFRPEQGYAGALAAAPLERTRP